MSVLRSADGMIHVLNVRRVAFEHPNAGDATSACSSRRKKVFVYLLTLSNSAPSPTSSVLVPICYPTLYVPWRRLQTRHLPLRCCRQSGRGKTGVPACGPRVCKRASQRERPKTDRAGHVCTTGPREDVWSHRPADVSRRDP